MRINVIELNAGSSLKVTWVNTGAVPSAIYSTLRDNTEMLVNSVTAIASGNGFYYAYHTLPTSYAQGDHFWMVNEWKATLNGYPFASRQFIRATQPGVD